MKKLIHPSRSLRYKFNQMCINIGVLSVIAMAGSSAALAADTSQSTPAGGATVIRVALSGGINRLDPGRTSVGSDIAIISQIYETLLVLDPKTGMLMPKLAKSFELKTPTLWEFKLRDDVKFHDGTPFSAKDVKYSLDRILNPATNSPHFSQLASIANVTIIDDHTIQIHTKVPDPLLGRRMQPIGGSGRVFIVPKDYFEARSSQEVNDKPIGTGPYQLAEWNKGTSLTLVRNPGYWGVQPDSQKAVFAFIPENSTRVNALLQGEVDVIERVPVSEVGRIEKAANTHVVSSPNGLVHTLLLDTRKPPFDDVDFRKAFVKAIDIKNVVNNLLGKYGRVLGAPMGPNVVQVDSSIQPYPTDRASSKQLLAGKAPVTLNTYTSDGRYVADREIYQAVNSQLASVGINVKPRLMEWGRLSNMMESRSAGPFYIIGWDFGERDASKMNTFLKSNSALSLVADTEYDRLADLAGAEMDNEARANYWKQAQKLVHDRYYIGAAWQAASIYGFSKRFQWEALYGENLDVAGIRIVAQ